MKVAESPTLVRSSTRLRDAVESPEDRAASGIWSDVLGYLFVVRHYWWLFLIVTAVVIAVVMILGLRKEKTYRAATTVLVAYSSPKVLKEGDDVFQSSYKVWEYQRYFASQPEVLTSREVLQEVVQALDLGSDDEFLGIAEMQEGTEKREARAKADPIKILRKRIEIALLEESLVLEIYVTDTDPHRAADIANAIATAYIVDSGRQRFDATSSAWEWLRDRATTLEGEVKTAEDSMVDFQRHNDFLGTTLEDSLNLVNTKILTLNTAATEAEIEYLELQTRYEHALVLATEGDIGAIPEVMASETIQDLKQRLYQVTAEEAEIRQRYGDLHPRLNRLRSQREGIEDSIARETQRILDAMQSELGAKQEMLQGIGVDLEKQRQLAMDLRDREMSYHRLERDLEQTEDLYKAVKDRALETELAGKLDTSNISVLDRATPPTRVHSPRLRTMAMTALVLGLSLGLFVVFVADRLDTSIRSHEQLEEEYHIPVLGIQPRFEENSSEEKAENAAGGVLAIARDPRGAAAESCRTIRTNLMFMAPGEELRTMLVTSAGPSEGKTSLASNLAYTMASAGKRTILVDTDMRRPRVHKVFELSKRPALASALIGEIDLETAIRPSGYSNLDILPLGNVPPNPAELLGSKTFAGLVSYLIERYDRVIFDSPPVMAVTDASILANLVDGVILVARQDATNRHVLRQAVRTLQTVNATILGFVLNDVDLHAARRGYYSYKYRYPYYHYTYRYFSRYEEDKDGEEEEGNAAKG